MHNRNKLNHGNSVTLGSKLCLSVEEWGADILLALPNTLTTAKLQWRGKNACLPAKRKKISHSSSQENLYHYRSLIVRVRHEDGSL